MKKISIFILSLCLLFSLPACSSVSETDVSTFFSALHKTMQLDSGTITGTIKMDNVTSSSMNFHLEFNQTKDLELALNVGLQSGNNKLDDYLQFYIRDGKTYMDNMGTTSQSVVENIGLAADSRLEQWDPFLSFTKKELSAFFTSTRVNGDTYIMEVSAPALSTLLDDMASVTVSKSDITANINDGIMDSITFYIEGRQQMQSQKVDFSILINAKLKNIDDTTVEFPADLEDYGK